MKKQIVFTSAMGQQIYAYTEGKTYVSSPGDAPKGTALKRGPRGGYYYEEPAGKGSKSTPATKSATDTSEDQKSADVMFKVLQHPDATWKDKEDAAKIISDLAKKGIYPKNNSSPDKEQGTKEPQIKTDEDIPKYEWNEAQDKLDANEFNDYVSMRKNGSDHQTAMGEIKGWEDKETDTTEPDTVEQGTKEEPETFYRYDEPVRIHPDLTTDPAGKQGEWGTIKDIKKDYIVVKFRDGTTGKYEPDALMGNGEEE